MNTIYINTTVMISLFKGEKRNEKTLLAIGAITITTLLAGCDFGDFVGQYQSDKQSENSNTQTEQAANNKNQTLIMVIQVITMSLEVEWKI